MSYVYGAEADSAAIHIEMIPGKDIESIKSHWQLLQGGKDMTVFQMYEWNKLQLGEFMKKHFVKVFYLVVFENAEPIMIAPLYRKAISSKDMPKGIYLLGYDSYADYLNFIYKEFRPDAFQMIVEYIKKHFPGYRLFFNYLRKDTGLYDYLHSREERNESVDELAVFIDLDTNSEEYNRKLSKSVRQNLRTSINRINKANISYQISVKGKIDNDNLCKRLVRLHAKRLTCIRLKGKTGIKWFCARARCFYEEWKENRYCIVRESMQSMDNSWLCIFNYNEEIAGYLYGLKDRDGIIRVMHNVFNYEYDFYSPSFRGLYDVITNCIEDKKVIQLDLTRGDEKYKYMFGGEEIQLARFELSL